MLAVAAMGELSSLASGNVGLARPIIPRGRICLIYYIHCVRATEGGFPLSIVAASNWNGERGEEEKRQRRSRGRGERDGWKGDFHQTHKWRLLISSRDNSTRPVELCLVTSDLIAC